MTCVAAVVYKGKVYMGADSAGVSGLDLDIRRDEKVFRVGEFLIGFTTSFRMGQLLQYAFSPPPLPVEDADLFRYMATDFIDVARDCLKAGGYAAKTAEQEAGGNFLVGVRGRLFQVASDYQVGESDAGFDAVGCGYPYAKGAMFAAPRLKPNERVLLALRAATRFSAGVRGPFTILGPNFHRRVESV